MNKKIIIKNIFKHYNSRKEQLILTNILLLEHKNRQLLRETEVEYGSDNGLETNIGLKIQRLSKKKQRLERLIGLRSLLLEQLEPSERELIIMRFEFGMRVNSILSELYFSESTYYRKMNIIFQKLTNYLNIFEDLFNRDRKKDK